MASASEEDADVLNSSSMQHTLVLDVVAKSRISESLQAHLALGLRQEQEEGELCEKIAGILAHGVPRARLASAMDENPVLTTGCKRIFRQWIDVAALRVASEECPAKVMRLVEDERGVERFDVVG